MTDSKCLIGNVFIAECKEQPLWVKRKNLYEKYIIRLKKSAGCEIKKQCDFKKEKTIINRFKRAFESVLIEKNSKLIVNNGELKCDFCLCPPKIKNKHTSLHKVPPFKITRIKNHPLICIENKPVTEGPYAEIMPEIKPVN